MRFKTSAFAIAYQWPGIECIECQSSLVWSQVRYQRRRPSDRIEVIEAIGRPIVNLVVVNPISGYYPISVTLFKALTECVLVLYSRLTAEVKSIYLLVRRVKFLTKLLLRRMLYKGLARSVLRRSAPIDHHWWLVLSSVSDIGLASTISPKLRLNAHMDWEPILYQILTQNNKIFQLLVNILNSTHFELCCQTWITHSNKCH